MSAYRLNLRGERIWTSGGGSQLGGRKRGFGLTNADYPGVESRRVT